MATTTNFGWETPDDTDLVKDGALAMRTLGNAIDASLVDLKGGTTGQVLSKTSNTDMDFTWVTSDDANAIQNAIVDAKGDLISASAADTPARLAVGNNGETLVADSSTPTGLKWAPLPAAGMTNPMTTTGDTIYSSSGSTPARLPIGSSGQVLTVSGGLPVWASPSAAGMSFTLISSTALTGASTITISGLSGYNTLFVIVSRASTGTGNSLLNFRMNGDSGSNYKWNGPKFTSSSFSSDYSGSGFTGTTSHRLGSTGGTANELNGGVLVLGANSTNKKAIISMGAGDGGTLGGNLQFGIYDGTSVISSVSVISNEGYTFDNGTLLVYGSTI